MATANGEKSLESWIWDAACSIRGAKDAAKYKDFILPLIFTKRLCDVFDDELNRIAKEVGSRAKAFELVKHDKKLVRFFLPLEPKNPDDAVWSVIRTLSDKTGGVAMLILVRWVVLVAPVGIFALILPLAAHSGAAIAGAIGFYIVAYSGASVLMTLLLYPVMAVAGRIPMNTFARAAVPAQLIAFSSSSSIASLSALVEGAERGLGLKGEISGFVLPLSVAAFKLASPVSWTVGALFIGWFYGIPLHAPQLATVAFAAVFLAFAAPGVPRGAFLMLTPLFLAIGLPAEGIGILIAVDAIPDMFATVLNVTGDLAAAALVARGEGDPVAEGAV